MTGPLAASEPTLPLWRAVGGFAVLGTLVSLLLLAASVYVENFRLDRYARSLAHERSSATISDAALTTSVLQRAKELDLPLPPGDISITRVDGQVQIRIAKYTIQTPVLRMDLRVPGSSPN